MKTWKRKELKMRARAGLKLYYLQAFIVSVILGLLGIGWSSANSDSASTAAEEAGAADGLTGFLDVLTGEEQMAAVTAILIAMLGVILLSSVVGMLIKIFVWNVIAVGGCRFYLENQKQPGSEAYSGLMWGFRSGFYGNIVKILFLRDLKIALWSLLFLIPGIVKAFEYQMIPYILAENPGISSRDAFADSRRMMTGNKWKSFILSLSFLGWEIASMIAGAILAAVPILGSVLTNVPGRCLSPYIDATTAELYLALRE